MAPMGLAASMPTIVRPRARPLAHASMYHASTATLTTHHPCECAGAEFFGHLRLPDAAPLLAIAADATDMREAVVAA